MIYYKHNVERTIVRNQYHGRKLLKRREIREARLRKEKKMKRYKVSQIIAIVATLFTLTGIIKSYVSFDKNFSMILIMIGFGIGLIAYIFSGFFEAIKMALGIAKWGLYLTPFPICIMTFLVAFIFAILILVALPIIPVRKAYKKHMYASTDATVKKETERIE